MLHDSVLPVVKNHCWEGDEVVKRKQSPLEISLVVQTGGFIASLFLCQACKRF